MVKEAFPQHLWLMIDVSKLKFIVINSFFTLCLFLIFAYIESMNSLFDQGSDYHDQIEKFGYIF